MRRRGHLDLPNSSKVHDTYARPLTPRRSIDQIPVRDDRSRRIVLGREFARRTGLLPPDEREYQGLGNPDYPIHAHKAAIEKMIADHPISVTIGETGSGKSTQTPKYGLEMGFQRIFHLVPQRVAVDKLTERLIEELSIEIGPDAARELCGAMHSRRHDGYDKRINIMTPETFSRLMSTKFEELKSLPILFIGDEIHQKDHASQLAVATVAKRLPENPHWRLNLVSATLDPESIQKRYGDRYGRTIPIARIIGRPHDVERKEEPELSPEAAYRKYGPDHQIAQIFVRGVKQVDELASGLRSATVRTFPLHSKLTSQQSWAATHPAVRKGQRHVVPSTNAGESSITIKGETLVIMSGAVNRATIDESNTPGLEIDYATQAEIDQQAGRSGRDVPGGLAVLADSGESDFPFKSYAEREAYPPAQIHSMDIGRSVLLAASLGEDFGELNRDWLLDSVKTNRVIDANHRLYRLGAMDSENHITDIGQRMNNLRFKPELARAVIEAQEHGASGETLRQLLAMVSAVGAGGLARLKSPPRKGENADIPADVRDDYMAQFYMWQATRKFYDPRAYSVHGPSLANRGYDPITTQQAHENYDKACRELGIATASGVEAPDAGEVYELQRYLTAGLFDSVFQRYKSTKSSKKPTYASISREDDERFELGRATAYVGTDNYVIASPRHFQKVVKGNRVELGVIEDVFPAHVQLLGEVASRVAEREERMTTIHGGRVQRHFALRLGRLTIGSETSVTSESFDHTPDTIKLLKDKAFQAAKRARESKSGNNMMALNELLRIKEDLLELTRLVPAADHGKYFPKGVLDQVWLDAKIDSILASGVGSTFDLDNALREIIVTQSVNMDNWVDAGAVEEIKRRSPEYITLGESGPSIKLHYQQGKPIVNGFNLRHAELLPDVLKLDDGREVMFSYRPDSDTKRYRAKDIKRFAKKAVRSTARFTTKSVGWPED